MKRIFFLGILLLGASLLLAACSPTEPADVADERGELKVVATTTLIGDVASQVAGDRVALSTLLPFGADPHSFQPTPQDVAMLAEADLVFINGLDLEEFLEGMLDSANTQAEIIVVSEGINPLESQEDHEHAEEGDEHEHEGEDHSPEAHSREVCEQLEGKTAEEEIQTGADPASAVELHSGEHAEGEHAHEREIVTLKLNAQADGSYAGYVLFDSQEKQGYAITSSAGEIVVTDAAGMVLEAGQVLTIDCQGMTVGSVYELPGGEYVVAVTGADAESVVFSAAPMHAHDEGEHEEEHVDEHEHEHTGQDPHVWMDPNNVLVWVDNIESALAAADPQNAAYFAENAEAYRQELRALDEWIMQQVEQVPPDRRLLVTDHAVFGYFAERYGFEQVGAVIPGFSTLSEPSAQALAALEQAIAEQGVPAIFVGYSINPDLAERVAEDTGIQIVSVHTGSLTDAGGSAPTYLDFLRYNVEAIVSALQ